MTLLNRPIGIWIIVVYSLYSMLQTAMSLFSVFSTSTVTYYNWDYFLFSGIHICLSIALIVTALWLRKVAMAIVITMAVFTLPSYAMSLFQLTTMGGIEQQIIISVVTSLASSLIILGVIWWYLSTLKKRGILR